MLKSIDKNLRRLLLQYGKCYTLHYSYRLVRECEVYRIRVNRCGLPENGATWEHVYTVRKVGY